MLLVVSFVGGMLFYALQSFWPTFLTLVYDGNDSIQVGIDGVPFSTAATVFGVGSLLLLPILGPMIGTNTIMSVAVLIQAIFIPLMALPGIDQKPMALAFSWFAGSGRFHPVLHVASLTLLRHWLRDPVGRRFNSTLYSR